MENGVWAGEELVREDLLNRMRGWGFGCRRRDILKNHVAIDYGISLE